MSNWISKSRIYGTDTAGERYIWNVVHNEMNHVSAHTIAQIGARTRVDKMLANTDPDMCYTAQTIHCIFLWK